MGVGRRRSMIFARARRRRNRPFQSLRVEILNLLPSAFGIGYMCADGRERTYLL